MDWPALERALALSKYRASHTDLLSTHPLKVLIQTKSVMSAVEAYKKTTKEHVQVQIKQQTEELIKEITEKMKETFIAKYAPNVKDKDTSHLNVEFAPVDSHSAYKSDDELEKLVQETIDDVSGSAGEVKVEIDKANIEDIVGKRSVDRHELDLLQPFYECVSNPELYQSFLDDIQRIKSECYKDRSLRTLGQSKCGDPKYGAAQAAVELRLSNTLLEDYIQGYPLKRLRKRCRLIRFGQTIPLLDSVMEGARRQAFEIPLTFYRSFKYAVLKVYALVDSYPAHILLIAWIACLIAIQLPGMAFMIVFILGLITLPTYSAHRLQRWEGDYRD